MGYYMEQRSCYNFLIKKENIPKALEAIKGLKGKETIQDSSGQHYSWVDEDYFYADNITDAMNCWRWNPSFDEEGNITDLCFEGSKLGDDEIFLKAIAPFVEHGQIEMNGEGGDQWMWDFEGKTLTERWGRVVYD